MPPKRKRKRSSVVASDKNPSLTRGFTFNRPQEELTGPPVDKSPRFVSVKLYLGPFRNMSVHPAHFEVVLADSTTMHGLKELIQSHMCNAANTIAIFRDANCSRASYLAPSLTFEQCGITGAHPTCCEKNNALTVGCENRNLGTYRGVPLFHSYADCHRNGFRRSVLPLCKQLPLRLQRCMSDTNSPLPNNDPAPGKDSQKQKGEPPEQDSQISWAQILPGVLVLLAYYMTSNVETLEVSFPYFLQHMLSTGEVERLEVSSSRDRVYIRLHPGAVINGVEAHTASRFVLTISGAESFETKLNAAQDWLGIDPDDRVPVNYRSPYSALSALVGSTMPLVILGSLWFFMYRRTGVGKASKGGGRMTMNPFNFMGKAKATIITSPSQITTK
ncbi:hypothetical protein EMCRGX_G031962 [Ephydatia muelleri]